MNFLSQNFVLERCSLKVEWQFIYNNVIENATISYDEDGNTIKSLNNIDTYSYTYTYDDKNNIIKSICNDYCLEIEIEYYNKWVSFIRSCWRRG